MDEAGLVAGLDPRNGPRQPPSAGSPSGFKHGFNGLKRIKQIGADEPLARSAPIRLIRCSKALAADADNEYAMIDSTIVRAHRHSAGAKTSGRTKRSAAPAVD